MKIQNYVINFIIFFQVSAIVVFIFFVSNVVGLINKQVQAQDDRYEMMQKADKLRQSSDDLTHFARTFVVTKQIKYKQQYFDTLKIRKGENERPLNYEGIYWDLDIDCRQLRHPRTKKISLKQLISALPYSDEELSLLKLSEKLSNELVVLETKAFFAMDEGKQNYAIELLHSKEYYEAKSKIMKPIDEFITKLDTRTKNNIKRISTEINFYQKIVFFLVLMYMMTNIFIFIYSSRQNRLLLKKENQLFAQSKLAQMGELISMIAHQWRQPLGAIASTSIDMKVQIELELYDLDNKDERVSFENHIISGLNNIEIFVQSLTKTIDDFRNFYKPNRVAKVQSINIPIEGTLNIIESSMRSNNIVLIKNYNSTKDIAMFDGEIMQVLLNIFKNAQDNFKNKDTQEATMWIETQSNNDEVVLTICDNGGGIPHAIIDKIFDPYFSTKNEKNGTGLGLYMSKMIIEEHHKGRLEVENKNDGVCFTIKLPVGGIK